ncbi:MAG: methylmalonyl Co-A mutase-associated GTPase MeaB [Bellilinea sp.]
MNVKHDLVESVVAGKRLPLARLLTLVENNAPEGRAALDQLFAHTGRAHLIGVTGSPGSGKSSLVNQIALALRNPTNGKPARSVAIVAVDPTSPFTGGAVLGDRVRMRDLAGDPGIFIRSMASRGALGGLARATTGVVQALDAAGFDIVLVETVGAGQAEVDIARLAHTTLVIEAPGMGDDIQAIKAGILEIADILVINKADHPGVDSTVRALRAMLELGHPTHPHSFTGSTAPLWIPPVLQTIATQSEGINELVEAIDRHAAYLHTTGAWQARDRSRLQAELEQLVQVELNNNWRASVPPELFQETLAQVETRQISPYQAAKQLTLPLPELHPGC